MVQTPLRLSLATSNSWYCSESVSYLRIFSEEASRGSVNFSKRTWLTRAVALDSNVVKLRVVVDQASKAVTAAAAAKIPVFADSDTAQLS